MNYKEKYEEALERARKLHSEPTGGTERIVCEQIFPELIESENEKIKEAAKHGLQQLGWEHINGIKMKDILAWLEKQGLQNLANSAKICKDDEEMLDSIIEDFGNGKTSNMLQEQWLKSLKERFV